MKEFFLMILMIDSNGIHHIERVNNIEYKDRLQCLIDKAIMSKSSMIDSNDQITKSIQYYCTNIKPYK